MTNGDGDRWIETELEECSSTWRAVSDTEGPRTETSLLWQGRADEALRVAIHFGVVDPEEGRRRMAALIPEPVVLRALSEPDGER